MENDKLKHEWLKKRGEDENFNLSFETYKDIVSKTDFITQAALDNYEPKYIDELSATSIDLAKAHLSAFQETGKKSYLNTAQFYIKKYIENGK